MLAESLDHLVRSIPRGIAARRRGAAGCYYLMLESTYGKSPLVFLRKAFLVFLLLQKEKHAIALQNGVDRSGRRFKGT